LLARSAAHVPPALPLDRRLDRQTLMTPKEDFQFLALLVHRGYVNRKHAEKLLPELKAGQALDPLLVQAFGWSEEKVRRLRSTRAGEEPRIPGFEFLGRLGVGGTADVFRVREAKTGRLLALKILNPRCTRDAAQLKAFVSEARMLEGLEHPALVKGHGVAKSGETYFARLELIEGQTLLELLDEGQAFEEQVALRIILEVANVLAYMASHDLVHRDVKPGNIMLTQNGAIKLIDLGFCVSKDERAAEDSAVGTVQYLSPEQAQGGATADFRSDIYSLGVTLFQLVVGRLPFEGSDDHEVLRMQVMESLSSPELKSRGLSPHLHYFIEKMMAKDADVRYQSWDEMIKDVGDQVAGRESLDYSRDVKSRARRRGLTRRK
jgi:serine/threonine protein kinase